jgi:hypothetical protein
MDNKKLKIFAIGLGFYLIGASVSYAGFSFIAGRDTELISPETGLETDGHGNVKINPQEPKTEACPLNNKLYTKTEKKIWEKRRPLAVMIENHTESRPQSGLSFADIVYEAVAEGGITRFMGIFYCGVAAQTVKFAPVRSARTYFVDWVSEYDALYNHVGGAGQCNDPTVNERAKALCQIRQYKIKDMDQFGISYPTCFRNPDRTGRTVATEHQMVCISNKLFDLAKERDWTNLNKDGTAWDKNFRSWKFGEDNPLDTPETADISFGFWEGYKDFNVRWKYNSADNSYGRFMGGESHIDFETKKQISAKNIVVQFTREIGPVDEHKHLLYKTIGDGKALIFKNGEAISGTWKKAKRTSRTLFFNSKGKEIKFVPGQIWIEIVPKGNKVEYK